MGRAQTDLERVIIVAKEIQVEMKRANDLKEKELEEKGAKPRPF